MKKEKIKCLLCGEKITDTELEFEDYYRITRGHTESALQGYICFDCFQTEINL